MYVIYSGNNDYIIRVSLPVQPRLKTPSERATIRYVLQHTGLPVPQIISSDACNNNELGSEWTIMRRVSGTKLGER